MEKKLREATSLEEVKNIINREGNDFTIGVITGARYDWPLTNLIRNYPIYTKAIEFYRDRTTSNDLRAAFENAHQDTFKLLLNKENADIALEAISFKEKDLWKLQACLAFPLSQEILSTALGKSVYTIECIKLLREKGAKFPRNIDIAMVMRNVVCEKSPLIDTILWAEEAKEYTEHVKNMALMVAVEQNNLRYAEQILKLGANNPDALHTVSYYGDNGEMAILLLRYGMDVNDNDGAPLNTAVNNNREKVVEALLDYKANVHFGRDFPLRTASENGNYNIVKMLLKAGAKVSVGNQEPIRMASREGRTEVVKLLLQYGANPRVKNKQALQWAKKYGKLETVAVLEKWIKEKEEEERENEESD